MTIICHPFSVTVEDQVFHASGEWGQPKNATVLLPSLMFDIICPDRFKSQFKMLSELFNYYPTSPQAVIVHLSHRTINTYFFIIDDMWVTIREIDNSFCGVSNTLTDSYLCFHFSCAAGMVS